MASIFISHSSNDKEFVHRLTNDLQEMGHTPWVDEDQIKAGESIISKITQGISAADYVVIVLSKSSAESEWFAREWEAKLWEEINKRKVMIIPALLESCKIPPLLQPKKYADFRKSYTKGVVELMGGISPVLSGRDMDIRNLTSSDLAADVAALLNKLQGRDAPLAQCLTEGLALAIKHKDAALESFCRQEISGWDKEGESPTADAPKYRVVQMYLSLNEINAQSWEWNGVESIHAFMRQHPDEFIPFKTFIRQSVPNLESQQIPDSSKAMIHIRSTLGQTLPGVKPDHAGEPVWIYGRVDSYRDVLEAIRQEYTEMLMERLPRLEHPSEADE